MHSHPVTIYYEDTDALGIVYHDNYLKYFERARTEYLKSLDVDLNDLFNDHGLCFVLKQIAVDYKAPAKLNDNLVVKTEVALKKQIRSIWHQTIWKDHQLITTAQCEVVCINQKGQPQKWPTMLQSIL